MNPKVIQFFKDNPDIATEARESFTGQLDQILENDLIFAEQILDQFHEEIVSRIAGKLAFDTGESYVDCLEVAQFYSEKARML